MAQGMKITRRAGRKITRAVREIENKPIDLVGERRQNIAPIFHREGSAVFSGTAYVAGNKTTGLNSDDTKPYVRCFLEVGTAEEHAGPMPIPFPDNEEWYEKEYTIGDIHIPRA